MCDKILETRLYNPREEDGQRRKTNIYWVPTMCQVLYISYFIDSYLVDLSALTVSIHKVSGAQRGQGHWASKM